MWLMFYFHNTSTYSPENRTDKFLKVEGRLSYYNTLTHVKDVSNPVNYPCQVWSDSIYNNKELKICTYSTYLHLLLKLLHLIYR